MRAMWTLCIVSSIFVGFWYLIGRQKPQQGAAVLTVGRPENVAAFRKQWAGRIQKNGGAGAYKELLKVYANEHFGTQHTTAHIFGEILFEKEGLPGFAVCDGSFSFGCYHGFVRSAILKHGTEVLTTIDESCVERYGSSHQSCQHGLGHAILEYVGYKKLSDALDLCANLRWQEPLYGCSSGVFMEYNFPVPASGAQTMIPRDSDPSYPYAPCPNVPARWRQSCYYELGQWLEKVYANNYEAIGQLCQALLTNDERRVCFRGIGNVIAPSSNYQADKTQAACRRMPTTEGVEACLEEARRSTQNRSVSPFRAIQMSETL